MKGFLKTEELIIEEIVAHHILIVRKLDRILDGFSLLMHDHIVDLAWRELSYTRILFDKLYIVQAGPLPLDLPFFLSGFFNEFSEIVLRHTFHPPLFYGLRELPFAPYYLICLSSARSIVREFLLPFVDRQKTGIRVSQNRVSQVNS